MKTGRPKGYVGSDEQIRTLRRIAVMGFELQNKHPEIAGLYRDGHFFNEIVTELGLEEEYGAPRKIVRAAAQKVVAGHNGGFGVPAYDGLIGEEERRELARKHMERAGKTSGPGTYKAGTGIFGTDPDTKERNVAKGGRMCAVTRGQTLWFRKGDVMGHDDMGYDIFCAIGEPEYAHWLYRQGLGYKEITKRLNVGYNSGNPVRKQRIVSSRVWRLKKGYRKTTTSVNHT